MTRPTTAYALIWVLGFIAFAPALSGPWLLDDGTIQEAIASLHAAGLGALAGGGWKTHLFLGTSGLGRPLSMATLAANALVSSEPAGFKVVNLLLHLATATLVYLLARRLLRIRYETATADAAALVVALLWTLHPLQLGTLGYVVQRMTILSALFSIWAMLTYVRLRAQAGAGAGDRSAVSWVAPLLVLPALATLAKENGALTPLFFFVIEATLFRFAGAAGTRRLLSGYFGLVLAVGVAVALWALLSSRGFEVGYAGRPFDMGERLLTQTRVLALYVGQILFPRLGAMPFFYDGLPHSTGWLTPPTTLTGALALLALLGLALGLVRARPLAACGILLFFAGHLMESSILPLELAFEHRNYLPSLGLILAVVDLTLGAGPALARLRPALGVAATLTLFALSLTRALAWGSAEQLYATAISSPWPSLRARAELAQTLTDQGRLAAARDLVAGADGVGPRMQEGYLDCLATAHLDPGRIHAAQAQIGRSISDYDASALILVVNLALDRACDIQTPALLGLVEDAAAAAVMQPTSRQKLLMYVGHLRHGLGNTDGAVAALEAGHTVVPANPMPLLLAGHWRLDAGDREAARDLYRRARAGGGIGRLDLEARFRELSERLEGSQGVTPNPPKPTVPGGNE